MQTSRYHCNVMLSGNHLRSQLYITFSNHIVIVLPHLYSMQYVLPPLIISLQLFLTEYGSFLRGILDDSKKIVQLLN